MARADWGEFERDTCKWLSLWWTDDARDDIFWRAQQSGGRATSRAKRGKTTEGHYGDVAAVHDDGKPLTDVLTLELKRGYQETTIAQLIDKQDHQAQQEFEVFVWQAHNAHELAGSFGWALVMRRSKRGAVIWLPQYVVDVLRGEGALRGDKPTPYTAFRGYISDGPGDGGAVFDLCCMRFDYFLENVTPDHIRAVSAKT